MTPTVALSLVEEIIQNRSRYLQTLFDLQTILQNIGIIPMDIAPGTAEIGVLLPRPLFRNHLTELIGELRTLNRMVRAFSEVATGAVEPVEVHEISTSDPIFFFGISATTIALIGRVVKWALDTWKQVEDVRKVRAETQKLAAFTEKEIKDFFDDKIDKTIREAIESKVNELLPVPREAVGRPHELRNDLAWALESILTRVERGVTVEIRFLPPQNRVKWLKTRKLRRLYRS